MADQRIFFRTPPAEKLFANNLLKADNPVAHFNQIVQINLLCAAMIFFLHTVEVKKLASGLQHSFGESEKFGLIKDRILL